MTGFGVDLTTHGTLKGGHVWASSHAKKIECRLWCDHVHVLTMRHASLGRHGTSAAIPAVCKGAKFLWLAGSASAGYCEFSWHKLEVYEFPKAITVPKSQEPDLGTEAYGCAANYRPQGAVTLDVQQYGFLAPGNQVSFSRRSRKTACKISCLGHSWKSINFNEGRSRSHRRRARDLPWWCTGASQIVLEGGGKCGGCHLKSHDMLVSPHPANNVKTGFPGKKIVAWFKSENAGIWPIVKWQSSWSQRTVDASDCVVGKDSNSDKSRHRDYGPGAFVCLTQSGCCSRLVLIGLVSWVEAVAELPRRCARPRVQQ